MSTVVGNIDIGARMALFTADGGGSEVNLGLTKEGAKITISGSDFNVDVDELTAPIASFKTAIEVSGEIELVEHTLDNLAIALRAVKTTVAGPPAKTSVDISPLAGAAVPTGKLVFHPRGLISTDKSKDVTIWLAMLRTKNDRVFSAKKNGSVMFSFQAGAKQDATTGKWFPLYTEGDPATAVLFDLGTSV